MVANYNGLTAADSPIFFSFEYKSTTDTEKGFYPGFKLMSSTAEIRGKVFKVFKHKSF